MTATITNRLSFIRGGMAYLNSRSHKAGLRAAIKAAGVYNLPNGSASRDDVLQAALRVYPESTYRMHDRQLNDAVIAAAEAWTSGS
ncbi:hypothetical protein ACFXG4_04005 [Nocardia sp. NPDC059246]|uniref:hypothetical protein n=1 Tax=unclassified Nocardia TaxID=2637762 RepID=UPI0036A23385